ncbi:uncharacterized protein [Solanum tuberosum]|uniref:uncharacterized protein n=1 Tax=Solanum tuberosum TaxID=4113 RepID=UPI000739FC2A|nr:PREDICTED: uncharacterized protein LOC102598149 [Solanum tuberosum]
MRFKCVSKFYDSIVLEPNFVDLHLSNYSKVNRGDTKLIAILDDVSCSVKEHDEDENATKFYQIENFNNFYDHIIGCWDYYLRFEYDNGLFCIWNAKYIAICNPATRENNSWRRFEVQEFPDRTRSIFTYSESLFPLENIGTIHHQP